MQTFKIHVQYLHNYKLQVQWLVDQVHMYVRSLLPCKYILDWRLDYLTWGGLYSR